MFGKNKAKEPFVVLMIFSKETLAEIAKNYLKEEIILKKIIKSAKIKYDTKDFMYMNFINDDNKLFKVIFQINLVDSGKEKNKLSKFVKEVFECDEVEIENKKDFNFEKLNLKHGLVKNDILIISKDNKQELNMNFIDEVDIRKNNSNPDINSAQDIPNENVNNDLDSYNFDNVIAKNEQVINQEVKHNIIDLTLDAQKEENKEIIEEEIDFDDDDFEIDLSKQKPNNIGNSKTLTNYINKQYPNLFGNQLQPDVNSQKTLFSPADESAVEDPLVQNFVKDNEFE